MRAVCQQMNFCTRLLPCLGDSVTDSYARCFLLSLSLSRPGLSITKPEKIFLKSFQLLSSNFLSSNADDFILAQLLPDDIRTASFVEQFVESCVPMKSVSGPSEK